MITKQSDYGGGELWQPVLDDCEATMLWDDGGMQVQERRRTYISFFWKRDSPS